MDSGEFFVSMLLTHRRSNLRWEVIIVYGPTDHRRSADFLAELKSKVERCLTPHYYRNHYLWRTFLGFCGAPPGLLGAPQKSRHKNIFLWRMVGVRHRKPYGAPCCVRHAPCCVRHINRCATAIWCHASQIFKTKIQLFFILAVQIQVYTVIIHIYTDIKVNLTGK